jgi:hypothetical protein
MAGLEEEDVDDMLMRFSLVAGSSSALGQPARP